MFFFRNKHIMVDFGTGDNNKIKWPMEDEQELIDIIEVRAVPARLLVDLTATASVSSPPPLLP
jgi:hypothetical protein